jgi:hypothetical protein
MLFQKFKNGLTGACAPKRFSGLAPAFYNVPTLLYFLSFVKLLVFFTYFLYYRD